MTEMDDEKRLTDYVLGVLPERDELRLEEEYVADAGVQERLLIVEDELVEAYLHGRLSGHERRQLEARFLASPRGERKLEVARSLMKAAAETRPTDPAALRPRDESPGRRWFSAGSARLVSAAAAVLLVLLLAWSIRERADEGRGLPRTASIRLQPVSRAVDSSPLLKVPHGTARLRLELELPTHDHESYRVALLDPQDATKWTGRGLRPPPGPSGKAIALDLPATLFETGPYTLVLGPDDDAARPIAQYSVVVERE